VTPPSFDHDRGLLECEEDFSIEQVVTQPTSVIPIVRIASATG
jgi:hypothetical protein